ncbi:hypothetical protein PBY51_011587 [Eleginops maclovinus]|uniref:Uncharacterized protein n=1 Tax=Eleginops maclovinus TaxID=56733 RepID=A0AAN8AU20_ELEMC|nr:hypothetical protein PBY51_011587 [Eleginops maclovinus]
MCAQSILPTYQQHHRRHTVRHPLPENQTPANKHVTFPTSCSHQTPPPCLPPMVTGSVFLPLRPPFSGLDGHHCRGEVRFINGHDQRPSPGKGVGGTGRENKHSSLGFKAGGSFGVPR